VGLASLFAAGLILAAHSDHEAEAHGAHVHGVGHLAIALDAHGRIEAELDTPGDNVFGFEHAPRDAAERRIVQDARSSLLAEGLALRFNGEAGCRYLGGDIAGVHEGEASHRDLRVSYRFQCAAPQRLTRVQTGLFEAFERFEEIEGVFISPARQEGFELTPSSPARRLSR